MLFAWVTTTAVVAVAGRSSAGHRDVTQQLPAIPRTPDAIYSEAVMAPLYEFAARHPETIRQMPCFCSCGSRLGHRSNLDCFITSDSGAPVVWNPHAAECQYCVAVARDAKQLFESGVATAEIRRRIEATYAAGAKYRTNTPHPEPEVR
ncbi:MAG: PCYCGC domain-containing protein [Cyanobacteria bacterium]|nr:PCYCGC domain-containing protein [Cyanobacteriota bacterium]